MESKRGEYGANPPISALPPYRPPSSGLLGSVPAWMLPYLQLARVDKPGYIIMYSIHVIGAVHAAIILKVPPRELGAICLYLLPASMLLILANFTWNDICDADVDALVSRSRHRPLVRNAISKSSAVVFNMALTGVLATFLLPLPMACKMYAIPMAAGAILYPFSKRFTKFPQVFLAFVISSGVFMGAAAIGQEPFSHPGSFTTTDILYTSSWVPADTKGSNSLIMTYLVIGLWTIVYELIYSYQDTAWDVNAGIGTMTVLFDTESSAKSFLYSIAVLQTLLFQYVGTLIDAHIMLWTVAAIFVALSLFLQIRSVDLANEESCMHWFGVGSALTGLVMLLGFLAEYYIQVARDGGP